MELTNGIGTNGHAPESRWPQKHTLHIAITRAEKIMSDYEWSQDLLYGYAAERRILNF